jgi:hypothetical protein
LRKECPEARAHIDCGVGIIRDPGADGLHAEVAAVVGAVFSQQGWHCKALQVRGIKNASPDTRDPDTCACVYSVALGQGPPPSPTKRGRGQVPEASFVGQRSPKTPAAVAARFDAPPPQSRLPAAAAPPLPGPPPAAAALSIRSRRASAYSATLPLVHRFTPPLPTMNTSGAAAPAAALAAPGVPPPDRGRSSVARTSSTKRTSCDARMTAPG